MPDYDEQSWETGDTFTADDATEMSAELEEQEQKDATQDAAIATAYTAGGTDVALSDGGTGTSLTDPGADRLMFWDDSTGHVDWLTLGTNLSITGTTMNASGGGGSGDVTGQASSVDSEVALFSGTGGKTIKRATGSGIPKLTSGVQSIATAGTDYVAPGGALGTPSSGTLTNCTDLPVTGGGTGRSTSTTAYGLIAAGTTATGAHQTLAAGATTEVLVGGGASALPTWTTATGSGAPARATSPALTTPTLTNPTITNYTESVVAIGNTGTSKTIDLTSGTVQTATLTGNCTFTMPTATAGKSFTLLLKTGAGSFTGTFTSVKWPVGVAPTITTTASRMDILTFTADGTNWYGAFTQNYIV